MPALIPSAVWPWASHLTSLCLSFLTEKMELTVSNSNCVKWECAAAAAKSLQSCPTLCDPTDGSPPGSSVHGIFQARVLEWGAIAFFEWECECVFMCVCVNEREQSLAHIIFSKMLISIVISFFHVSKSTWHLDIHVCVYTHTSQQSH